MRGLRRTAMAVAALLAAASLARAEPESLRKRVEDALLAGDGTRAVALLDEAVARAGETERADLVDAARTAFDLLPHDTGNARAAALIGAALEKDSRGDGAWQFALRLQDRLLEELDYAVGEPFARKLIALYDDSHYRRELGTLQLRCGRTDEARETYEALLAEAPSDVQTLYDLATLEDRVGNEEQALRHYDRIIELRDDHQARLNRAQVLAKQTVGRYEDARVAIAETTAKVRETAAGKTRDWYLQSLGRLKTQVDDAMEQRDRLVALDTRLDRLLWSLGAGWLIVLGGGVAFLRRRRLI